MKIQSLNAYFICLLWSSRIEWLCYMRPLEFQGLNGIIYASFGVVRFIWLLSMHLLEFQGLDSYYICVFWTFRGHNVLRNVPKTFLCFNTWGTNLGRVLYSHLIQHRHCCRMSKWRIHMAMMTCQFVLEFICQGIF